MTRITPVDRRYPAVLHVTNMLPAVNNVCMRRHLRLMWDMKRIPELCYILLKCIIKDFQCLEVNEYLPSRQSFKVPDGQACHHFVIVQLYLQCKSSLKHKKTYMHL